MMCDKKSFPTMFDAHTRAQEINKKERGNLMRPYKCDKCDNFHLTSMTKHKHRVLNDIDYRNNHRQNVFLKNEVSYWEEKLNVK